MKDTLPYGCRPDPQDDIQQSFSAPQLQTSIQISSRLPRAAVEGKKWDKAVIGCAWRDRQFPTQADIGPEAPPKNEQRSASKWPLARFLPMRRIIYTSRSLTEGDLAELDAIVGESVARNVEAGITGVLWSDGANFAQVIEGGHDEVEATMDRILIDPRHTDIDIVLDRAVLSRQFGNWAMRRAGDAEGGTSSTAFLLGFALGEQSASAKRLYGIVIATEK